MHESKLNPNVIKGVSKKLIQIRKNQKKKYFDMLAKKNPTFEKGEDILLQKSHRNWVKAKVVEKTQFPRSFIVKQTDNNNIYH